MEARTAKKRLTILMAALVVAASLAAQPASAQEDRRSGEGSVQTQQSGKQENCAPGPVSGGEYVCATGSFTITYYHSAQAEGCVANATVDWGDGSSEQLPVIAGDRIELIDVPHQYKKRGTYEVEAKSVLVCLGEPFPFPTFHWTVEVPGAEKCDQGSSRMATTSSEDGDDDGCSDEDCHIGLFGFCLIDTELKKAKFKVKKLKKELDKIKAINDLEEQAKQLRKIQYDLQSARQEYENLLRQSEAAATENARELGVSQDYVLKEFNGALKGKK